MQHYYGLQGQTSSSFQVTLSSTCNLLGGVVGGAEPPGFKAPVTMGTSSLIPHKDVQNLLYRKTAFRL